LAAELVDAYNNAGSAVKNESGGYGDERDVKPEIQAMIKKAVKGFGPLRR
jgi:hypothetical protein